MKSSEKDWANIAEKSKILKFIVQSHFVKVVNFTKAMKIFEIITIKSVLKRTFVNFFLKTKWNNLIVMHGIQF